MNIAQIENNIKTLVGNLTTGEIASDDFIYELLLAYGHRNSTISMLRKGHYNIAKEPDEIIFKRHLYFKQIQGDGLHVEIDRMKNQKLVVTNRTRFVIITNFDHLLAVDTKTNDTLDILLSELPNKFDFFLPWAGMEKAVYQGESLADVKAAEKMAKLFDLIKADNFTEETLGDKAALHSLNVFLTRLLFCFFAEDTEIFSDNQFSKAIQSHTSEDGIDVADYLNRLFVVLNTAGKDRGELPEYLVSFPYVNGGLFADNIKSPTFSRKSRRMLIECGSELNWSDINPDIFGSMIQAVVHPEQRGGLGMHYTSITNIMKVIEPLFLNDLYEDLDKVSNNSIKLQKLQQRLSEIKVFDPACGSGNFLIIAYKELRRLEMELLKRLQELELEKSGQIFQPFSVIKLYQFYGIELDDFAHEVAILSLWLAEHQMNVEFKTEFGNFTPSLPLRKSGNIVCGNAVRIDWVDVCDNSKLETYVIGNPPYLGESYQSKSQKSDMDYVFKGTRNYKKQDYISCWFYLASKYINLHSSIAFVSTSSVCQGIQVGMLWPHIFSNSLEIAFCHKPFQWKNNAKDSAGVYCIVVGLRKRSDRPKYIFDECLVKKVKNITPYLIEGDEVIVSKIGKPLFNLPIAMKGNGVYDGGNFMLSPAERNELVAKNPKTAAFLKRVTGTNEFIKGIERWCIWIDEADVDEANSLPEIRERINRVKEWRVSSGVTAQAYSSVPYRFKGVNRAKNSLLVIPAVSSDNRPYIPMAFLSADTIVTDLAFMILEPEPYIFSLLSSAMHQIWVRTVTGRLGDGFRYSLGVCYNSFPTPSLTDENKYDMAEATMKILAAREDYPDKNLSQLYASGDMPLKLLKAHEENDRLVDSIYASRVLNDDERMAILFKMYSKKLGDKNA